jgi:hypothetical protein
VPELAPIAEQFRSAQTGLVTRDAEHDAAADAVIGAAALRDVRRNTLRKCVRTAGHMIRRVGGGRSNSRLYRAYFPDGMRVALRGSVDADITRARDILTRLDGEQDPLLRDQIPPLSTALQAVETAVRQHEEAVANERWTRAELDAEKLAWIDGYRATHSRLRLHYLTSPDRAEEFFRRSRHDVKDPEQPDQLPPPQQPQTAGLPSQTGTVAGVDEAAGDAVAEAA